MYLLFIIRTRACVFLCFNVVRSPQNIHTRRNQENTRRRYMVIDSNLIQTSTTANGVKLMQRRLRVLCRFGLLFFEFFFFQQINVSFFFIFLLVLPIIIRIICTLLYYTFIVVLHKNLSNLIKQYYSSKRLLCFCYYYLFFVLHFSCRVA